MPDIDASAFPPILTTAMAAELLHVHVEYLRRMVREGRIPAHRFPGGREIRFHRDEDRLAKMAASFVVRSTMRSTFGMSGPTRRRRPV